MMRKVVLLLCSSALACAGIIENDYYHPTSVSYSSISTPTVIKTITTSTNKKTNTEPINYTKIIQSPPIYEAVITTKESKFESPDGTQHSAFSKSVDTAYSSFKKIQSTTSNNGDILGNSIPSIYTTSDYSPIAYNTQSAYAFSSPLVHTVSAPVYSKTASVPIAYTAHDIPATKTILSPAVTSYSTPHTSKTKIITSDLSSYSSPLEHTFSNPAIFTNHEIPLTKTLISPTVNSAEPLPSKTSDLTNYSFNKALFEAQPIKTTLTYSDAPVVSHTSFNGLGTSYTW